MSDRSEFLIGQMSQWIEDLSRSGRVEHLFELEMWLKSFERYFRVSNQPQARESSHALAIRSFYEEVALVGHAVHRVTQLCTRLASEDQVNQERFDKYVENYLRDGDVTDPYIARLLHQSSPQAGLALLREGFEDIYLILSELTKLSRVPYATFQSVGRLIYREIRRDEHLALLMDNRFKPAYDRIRSERVLEVVTRRIEDKDTRRLLAKVFLEFFRLLHYLEFTDPKNRKANELRMTVLIFSLISSEARTMLDFIQRGMRALGLPQPLKDTLDSFVYCLSPRAQESDSLGAFRPLFLQPTRYGLHADRELSRGLDPESHRGQEDSADRSGEGGLLRRDVGARTASPDRRRRGDRRRGPHFHQ